MISYIFRCEDFILLLCSSTSNSAFRCLTSWMISDESFERTEDAAWNMNISLNWHVDVCESELDEELSSTLIEMLSKKSIDDLFEMISIKTLMLSIIERSSQYKMKAKCSRLKQDDQDEIELNDLIKCVCISKECYLQMFEILSSHDVYRICLFDRSLIVIISWHLFRIESKSLVSKSTIMLIEFMWAMMTCIERWDFFWLEDRAFEMFETIFHWDRIDRRQSFAMRIILRHDVLWFLECNEVFV